MLDLKAIHKYGTDNSYTYFFHYKDSICKLVRVDVKNNTISNIAVIDNENKWLKTLRELYVIKPKQRKLTFENLQKLLLLYKIMGFNLEENKYDEEKNL